ncbi:hypothetical protein [Flavobacterium sp.]|uniref:hypothetical protein n=1 Tax=Flavobacterium sp. TaxID=239 RepID=UPI002610C468|nr:hypothetical protein [Flavobacterium sp.]
MIETLKYLVKEICKSKNDFSSLEIIENSDFEYTLDTKQYNFEPDIYRVCFKVLPTIFVKHIDQINRINGIIEHYFNSVFDQNIIKVKKIEIKPDIDKISILNTEVSIIETPWDEINVLQKQLINIMKTSSNAIDFQNIGNTCRTIMDKLARIVFNPEIHKPSISGVDVSNGKFKNQFHTYISQTLQGNSNKELRQFAKSSIDFTENAIDLMNQTTHKLDVQKHFAEVCIISTISIISLIKAINEV